MTEQEWEASGDPLAMLEFLKGKVSERKLRLFAVACWLRFPLLPNSSEWWEAVRVVERYADGATEPNELTALIARRVPIRDTQRHNEQPADVKMLSIGLEYLAEPNDWEAAFLAAVEWATRLKSGFATGPVYRRPENIPAVIGLIRCTVGNPFRPITAGPSWLTTDVLSLAEGIYTGKVFDRMPILADALMDAGCANDDLLNHCRQPGEHVRGCWALDLVLGKS